MPKPLTRVRGASAKLAAARAIRDDAIRAAHAAGESNRAIAEAAGVSHTQVQRILKGLA